MKILQFVLYDLTIDYFPNQIFPFCSTLRILSIPLSSILWSYFPRLALWEKYNFVSTKYELLWHWIFSPTDFSLQNPQIFDHKCHWRCVQGIHDNTLKLIDEQCNLRQFWVGNNARIHQWQEYKVTNSVKKKTRMKVLIFFKKAFWTFYDIIGRFGRNWTF